MKLDSLIYVSDLSKSITFYIDILGFKLGDLYPNNETATYAPIFIDENKLMLCSARESNKKLYPNGLSGSGTQFFIQVDKVDDFFKKVKNKVEIVDNLETKSWGDREFTIKDPDGYLFSFYSPTK